MSWDNNPYYNPEKHGLVKVAEADLSEPFYSFDLVAVWADRDGFWIGTDSGCSCPSPFEMYNGRADMTGPLTADQVLEEVSDLKGTDTYDLKDWNAFIATIRDFDLAEAPA